MNTEERTPITPNSNSPQPKKKKLKTWQIILIAILAVGVIGAVANSNSKKTTTTADTSSVSVSETEYIDIDYLKLYENNDNYKDKYVKICGQISSIDKNIVGTVYITFNEGISGLTGEIYCNIMSSKADETLSKYKENDYVEIAGKVGDMTLKTLNIDDAYVVSDGDSVKAKMDGYKKEASEIEASKAEQVSKQTEMDKETYIQSCETYTYKEIARNPNNYIDKKAKFEGKVIQVVENGNNVVLRVNVTKEENQFAEDGYLYSDTIYVEYTRKTDNESRILNDDIITMYGVLNGTKSYDSVLSGNITVPFLIAEYIDIQN